MPTATGLRISSVNGTAFLDNCPADILAAVGIGAQIKIYDSSSRYLQGVIGAVGSSEGLGGELNTLWTNLNYDTFTPDGIKITAAETGGQACNARLPSLSFPTGKLYCFVTSEYTKRSGVNQSLLQALNNRSLFNPLANGTIYTTGISTDSFPYIFSHDNTDFTVKISIKQVTAPSSSGVIIKDLSGNQNFISKDANFTYNAASYTYEIISAGNAFNYFQNMMR